jgi:hypothetical protein
MRVVREGRCTMQAGLLGGGGRRGFDRRGGSALTTTKTGGEMKTPRQIRYEKRPGKW